MKRKKFSQKCRQNLTLIAIITLGNYTAKDH